MDNDIKFQKQTFEFAKALCSKQKNAPMGILLTMVVLSVQFARRFNTSWERNNRFQTQFYGIIVQTKG